MENLRNMEQLIKYMKFISNKIRNKVEFNNFLIGYVKQMILND